MVTYDVEGYIFNDPGHNVLVNDNLLPNTNNTFDLGANAFASWSTIYGQNLNPTGNINATGAYYYWNSLLLEQSTLVAICLSEVIPTCKRNVYNSGGDVTINDNLTIPDGAGKS